MFFFSFFSSFFASSLRCSSANKLNLFCWTASCHLWFWYLPWEIFRCCSRVWHDSPPPRVKHHSYSWLQCSRAAWSWITVGLFSYRPVSLSSLSWMWCLFIPLRSKCSWYEPTCATSNLMKIIGSTATTRRRKAKSIVQSCFHCGFYFLEVMFPRWRDEVR